MKQEWTVTFVVTHDNSASESQAKEVPGRAAAQRMRDPDTRAFELMAGAMTMAAAADNHRRVGAQRGQHAD